MFSTGEESVGRPRSKGSGSRRVVPCGLRKGEGTDLCGLPVWTSKGDKIIFRKGEGTGGNS